ncbi:MAG: type II toxin-antitoxin system RelE/ParE family toxin [Candidatus Nomurabacteria bacterium]|jgi:mRNA interferase RelE/StbE|nr:type II toxin-antitoxin system RelE/ParE family toxin [Candidatus Nomurabacteria bacterium]
MVKYKLEFSKTFLKNLRKIDCGNQKIIARWIDRHLHSTADPRDFGKALKGDRKGFWRYRIGVYRIIAEINDGELILLLLEVDHRKDIYR